MISGLPAATTIWVSGNAVGVALTSRVMDFLVIGWIPDHGKRLPASWVPGHSGWPLSDQGYNGTPRFSYWPLRGLMTSGAENCVSELSRRSTGTLTTGLAGVAIRPITRNAAVITTARKAKPHKLIGRRPLKAPPIGDRTD